jgi:hypothetical protein
MSSLETNVVEIIEDVEREEAVKEPESDLITLSNGVVLEAVGVPPLLAQKIEAKFKYPRVPKTFNEDKGRDEENPLDPNYLAQCEEIDEQKNMALIDLLVGLGTRIKTMSSSVPKLEETEWREEIAFYLQEEIPTSPKAAYLYWVKYVLVAETADLQQIARKVTRKMGVSEGAVGNALTELKSN